MCTCPTLPCRYEILVTNMQVNFYCNWALREDHSRMISLVSQCCCLTSVKVHAQHIITQHVQKVNYALNELHNILEPCLFVRYVMLWQIGIYHLWTTGGAQTFFNNITQSDWPNLIWNLWRVLDASPNISNTGLMFFGTTWHRFFGEKADIPVSQCD